MPVSKSDDQVRSDILELLYKRVGDAPSSSGVDRAIIQANLGISEKKMDDNMSYLESNSLVALNRVTGSQWSFAKITSDGIDVIENKERYADKFLFIQASTNQITDESPEKLVGTTHDGVSFNQQVTDAFTKASGQVLDAKISIGEKGKIEKQLKVLEKELLKTNKADLGAIQKYWEWLNKNASWLNPTIAQVVLRGIKITMGLQ